MAKSKLLFCGLVLLFVIGVLTGCKPSDEPSDQPPEQPSDQTPNIHTQDVYAAEETTVGPAFGGISVKIAPGVLAKDGKIGITRQDPAEASGLRKAIGLVYDIVLTDTSLTGEIEIALQMPDSQAGEIAQPYIVHWTGLDWEYLEAVETNGWLHAKVSSFSKFAVGYRTEVILERSDGAVENGWLEVHTDENGSEAVVFFNAKGESINGINVSDYRGGILFNSDKIKSFVLTIDMFTDSGFPLGSFNQMVEIIQETAVEVMGEVVLNHLGDVTVKGFGGWKSSCTVEEGYDVQTSLGLQYHAVELPNEDGSAQVLWLYIEVTQAENVFGDSIHIVLFSDRQRLLTVSMNSSDMIPHAIYRVKLSTPGIEIPLPGMKLIAFITDHPNLPWWQEWQEKDSRTLCIYGDLSSHINQIVHWELVDTFFLDTHVSTVSSNIPLQQETEYRVIVSGTWSLWNAGQWGQWSEGNAAKACGGVAEESAMYPSPSVTNEAVSSDAYYLFAYPNGSPNCSDGAPVPVVLSLLRVNLGAGDEAIPEILTREFNARHVYQYRVIGEGNPLQMRLADPDFDDNYGQLRVIIEAKKD